MAEVRVEPAAMTVTLEPGESLLDAAFRAGWRWPSICHGNAECLVCWVQVIEGAENVVPPGPIERAALEVLAGRQANMAAPAAGTRLACQISFTGDAVVKRVGLRL